MSDITVTDKTGRVISLRTGGPEDMLDLMEMVPACDNPGLWMRQAMVAFSVQQIGDVPIPRATKKAHIRATLARLGNDGYEVVAEALFGAKEGETEQTEAEAVKN
jgi:hypothetical protein